MKNWLSVTEETIKDKLTITAVLTLIFLGLQAMYIGVWPTFEDEMQSFANMPFDFIRGYEYLIEHPFPSYLNMEMYQIFFILILGILIAYVSASLISEEIESKTIDMLMSNPISRKQIVLEKFLGIIPMVLIVNFATFAGVYSLSSLIGEEIGFSNLLITHLTAIPYLLSIVSISLFISAFVSKKMKASITAMGVVVGMYLLESISNLTPNLEKIGLLSIINYYDPSDLLILGKFDITGSIVLTGVTIVGLVAAVLYFDWRDIT